jgi:hypothetical protein
MRVAVESSNQGADETCGGQLECAFNYNADPEFVRYDSEERPYFVGRDLRDGYRRLCQSHHNRYGFTTADVRRRAWLSDSDSNVTRLPLISARSLPGGLRPGPP